MTIAKKQGLTFHLSSQVKSAEVTSKGVELKVEQETFKGDVVLVAVGRRPYTKNLGLKEIGIETDSKGFITVDGNFRTKYPHIFAIGDVVDGAMLAHRAFDEGVVAIEKRMTLSEIAYASHAHPTLSETIKEAAQAAQ